MDGKPFLKGAFAKEFRLKLWKEHFKVDNEIDLEDPVGGSLFDLFKETARKNMEIVRNILNVVPEEFRVKNDFPTITNRIWFIFF